MAKDYYKILGIARGASADDIKKAYRKLAHEFHPDKAGDDAARHSENERRFKEINEAYQVLSDPNKRQQYDQFGTTFDQASRQGAGPGFDGFSGFGGGGNVNIDFEDLQDLFGGVFGGFGARRGGQRRGKRGADIEVAVTVTLHDVVKGVTRELKLYKSVVCPTCKGSGGEPGAALVDCRACGGRGQSVDVQNTIFGSFQTVRTCTTCGGRGKVPERSCKQCRGTGASRDTVRMNIAIPPGTENGQVLRLSGEGEAGREGGAAGDLYVAIHVEPDKRFDRRGDDVVSQLAVSFSEAALGVARDIETVDGTVTLQVPAGTQGGSVLRLAGKGVPHLNGRGRGDQLVVVTVKTPTKLSRQSRKLFEDLHELEG